MTWVRAGLALLNLLDFFSRQIERWQIRQSAKVEVERDELKVLADAIRKDGRLETRLRRDPNFRDELRRHYSGK